ncbi:NUDIX hydrolase [Actinophytocola sp. KF-1]
MPTAKHSVSVAGVVIDESDRVLLIQRCDNGHWEPPGGVLELDETFEQGVIREVQEETGLRVEVERLTGVYKNMNRGVVALVFRCHKAGGREATTPESRRVEWMTPDQAAAAMTPTYYIRITDAFEHNVKLRAHNGIDLLEGALHEPNSLTTTSTVSAGRPSPHTPCDVLAVVFRRSLLVQGRPG